MSCTFICQLRHCANESELLFARFHTVYAHWADKLATYGSAPQHPHKHHPRARARRGEGGGGERTGAQCDGNERSAGREASAGEGKYSKVAPDELRMTFCETLIFPGSFLVLLIWQNYGRALRGGQCGACPRVRGLCGRQ